MNMSMSRAASLFELTDAESDAGAGADGGIDEAAEEPALQAADFDAAWPASPPLARVDDAMLGALIARVVDRDQRALATLYDATSARVYGLVLRITQRRALAEEVLADTYWQVWRLAPRFDAERGAAITWLLAMARTRAIDALRRNQCFQHEPLGASGACRPA